MVANKLRSGETTLTLLKFKDRWLCMGRRAWCDFVIYTKSISIERIYFDEDYWLNTLLPKLVDFLTIV